MHAYLKYIINSYNEMHLAFEQQRQRNSSNNNNKKAHTATHRILYLFINHIVWSAAFTTLAHYVLV